MTPDSLLPADTSPEEIASLFERFDVAIADARLPGQSVDGRYVDAYTAGFLLAKVVVRASGYRVKGGENHRDTLIAVPWLMGTTAQPSVDALNAARKQRNADLYDGTGMVDEADVADLLRRVTQFERAVHAWIATEHPDLA